MWTYGFAYGNEKKIKILDKVLFFVTMGRDFNEELRQRQVEAMKEVMIGDRINDRANHTVMYVSDRMTKEYDPIEYQIKKEQRLRNIKEIIKKELSD